MEKNVKKPPANPKTTREAIWKRIEDYCAETGTDTRTFGFRAIKDGSLVDRLRAGSDITTRKLDAILKFLPPMKPTTKK